MNLSHPENVFFSKNTNCYVQEKKRHHTHPGELQALSLWVHVLRKGHAYQISLTIVVRFYSSGNSFKSKLSSCKV